MPLTLSHTQKSAAQILSQLRLLQAQYEQPMITMDAMINDIIALPSDQLADLGNEIGATDLGNLLAAHAAQVAGVNQLANGIEQIIASVEGREAVEIRTASTLSLYERLAQQSREIIVADGVFSVSPIAE